MTKEDIISMAREAGLAYGTDEKPLNSVTRFAALAASAEREKLAAWMIQRGYATGHGDTIKDLLKELEWQIAEREREACAKVCDVLAVHPEYASDITKVAAQAIRARG